MWTRIQMLSIAVLQWPFSECPSQEKAESRTTCCPHGDCTHSEGLQSRCHLPVCQTDVLRDIPHSGWPLG